MIIDELFEAPQQCPECGGISFSDLILAEKKDACYYKVKASAKVWPSAYASGRLVQCRKKGAANYGNKSEGVAEGSEEYCDACDRVITKKPHVCPGSQGVAEEQELDEKWSQKYKSSINCADPKGFSQKAHCAGRNKNEDVAEAKPPGSRRDPLDLPPLEGPGAGGGHQVPQFSVPIIPDYAPGGSRMPMSGGPKWTQTKIPGVDIHTGPLPTVTKVPNINKKIDPAAEVPAYVRKGLPDPVTVPKPGTKATVKVRPGETMDQAMQRTRAEQEFGNFLKGQSGQSFGAGGGRGGQGGPTAAQATSGSGQVPTVTLPGGQTVPDPYRLSPSGQYSTQSKSNSEMDKIMQKWDKEQRSAPSSSSSPSKSKTSPSKFLQLFGPDKMDEASRKKREQPEVNYDDEYDAMVARVKKLAGLGPMRTVYDPTKRQYRNIPTAQQPKK